MQILILHSAFMMAALARRFNRLALMASARSTDRQDAAAMALGIECDNIAAILVNVLV
jgi:hypothetical protein